MEIVQSRLGVVDIAAVAEGVDSAEGGGHAAGGAENVAPCVIGVRLYFAFYINLEILNTNYFFGHFIVYVFKRFIYIFIIE